MVGGVQEGSPMATQVGWAVKQLALASESISRNIILSFSPFPSPTTTYTLSALFKPQHLNAKLSSIKPTIYFFTKFLKISAKFPGALEFREENSHESEPFHPWVCHTGKWRLFGEIFYEDPTAARYYAEQQQHKGLINKLMLFSPPVESTGEKVARKNSLCNNMFYTE